MKNLYFVYVVNRFTDKDHTVKAVFSSHEDAVKCANDLLEMDLADSYYIVHEVPLDKAHDRVFVIYDTRESHPPA